MIDVRRILSIQIDHFNSKSIFWYVFTLIEAVAVFYYLPIIGRYMMAMINKCIVPDVKDGVV